MKVESYFEVAVFGMIAVLFTIVILPILVLSAIVAFPFFIIGKFASIVVGIDKENK